ncbi:MAG: NAD(P)/FAD-dependent oxidoreductase [Thermoflexaceae bacterium]|nr:NAD(P)/FAD-dependent oxidoreductase [Thermoflexaceae bacterium]
MKEFFDIIIIGGGASGMMAAIAAAESEKKVLILEHNERLGKKILQTGNGRCNLTNLYMEQECYCRENSGFAMNVIRDFNQQDVMSFFQDIGLMLHDRGGYVYPNSDQASSVNEVLYLELKRKKINVRTQVTIKKITKKKPEGFEISTEQGIFQCNRLILATGSKAYPKSGSDGSGYELAQKLGHTVMTPLPALTSLQSDFPFMKSVSGVRCDGLVKLLINGEETIRERGEIQMTDYGISGIPVFQISRYAVQEICNKKRVSCILDFLPDYSEMKVIEFIRKKKERKDLTMEEAVGGMINRKLSSMILNYLGYPLDAPAVKLKENDLRAIAIQLKNLKINITGYNSFDYGQVCQGGVDVKEINYTTMESRKVKGLYFAGEIVDVDGICGGYNLQWAWSSGHKAGKAAAQ